MTKPSDFLKSKLKPSAKPLKPSQEPESQPPMQSEPSRRLGTLSGLFPTPPISKPSTETPKPESLEELSLEASQLEERKSQTSQTSLSTPRSTSETSEAPASEDLPSPPPRPSEQLLKLFSIAEETKAELRKPSDGPKIRLLNLPEERQRLYREKPSAGSFLAFAMTRAIWKHRDAPMSHPFMVGLIDYAKKKPDTANPYPENSWGWWMWFSGYHKNRRESGERLEGDVA